LLFFFRSPILLFQNPSEFQNLGEIGFSSSPSTNENSPDFWVGKGYGDEAPAYRQAGVWFKVKGLRACTP
jgi:hypothetical protein